MTEAYRRLNHYHSPLFAWPQWLDAVCSWEAVVVEDRGTAALAIPRYHKGLFELAEKPDTTPYLCPILQLPPDLTGERRAQRARLLLQRLLEHLPERHRYYLPLYPGTDGMPFHQAGFQLLTRYTYCLDLSVGPEHLWDELKSELRTQIRKSEPLCRLNPSGTTDDLMALMKASHIPHPPGLQRLLQRRLQALPTHQRVLLAQDPAGHTLAALLLAWDHHTAYLNLSVVAAQHKDTAANAWLHWQAIQQAQALGLGRLDFEGSMLPGVARFYSSFGATQTPYLAAQRNDHWLMRSYQALKRI